MDYGSESDYEPSSGGDMSSDSGDDLINLPMSPNLNHWQNGVAAGYYEGWDDGINSERNQHNPTPTFAQAFAIVGAALVADINAIRNNPPNIWITDGTEQEEGHDAGYGSGFQAAAALAFRLLGWARANYPAIPAARRLAAIAQNGGYCNYCNVAASTQADHVYPVQKHWVTLGYQGANLGDVNDVNNLAGSCGPCNGAKSNTYLNNWNPLGWVAGQWFPWLPAGTIPARRGAAIALGNW